MGTRVATTFAKLFMEKLERKMLDSCPKNLRDLIFTWKRYVDDVLIIFTGSHSQFNDLMNHINSVHETIKFDAPNHNEEENSCVFLDMTIKIKENNLECINCVDSLKKHVIEVHSFTNNTKHDNGIHLKDKSIECKNCSFLNVKDIEQQDKVLIYDDYVKNNQCDSCKSKSIVNSDTKDKDSCKLCDMPFQKEIKIITDLYRKDIEKPRTLLPSSSHPKHISRNIPFSMAYRYMRICSEENDFKKRLNELKF